MRFYLAGRYGRRSELDEYAALLKHLGHTVTSRWLDGVHEAKDAAATDEEKMLWALDDMVDIQRADWLVHFCEPDSHAHGASRGGRHVEFGIALAQKKNIAIVGKPENIFHCLAGWFFDTPAALLHFCRCLPIGDPVNN
jgi:hypothetical protein